MATDETIQEAPPQGEEPDPENAAEVEELDPEPSTLECPACGHGNPIEFAFCEQCGESLTDQVGAAVAGDESVAMDPEPLEGPIVAIEPVEAVVGTEEAAECSACGQANPSEFSFCEQCGESLTVEPEPVAPDVPVAVTVTDRPADTRPEPARPAARKAGRRTRRSWWAAAAVVVVGLGGGAAVFGPSMWGGGGAGDDTRVPPSVGDLVAPILTARDVMAKVDLTDPNLVLNEGFEVSEPDGTQYRFADHVWTASVPVGEGEAHESRLGSVAGRFEAGLASPSFAFEPGVSAETRAWAEQVLGDAPGVTQSSGGWVLSDPAAFDERPTWNPAGGSWILTGDGSVLLFDDLEIVFIDYLIDEAWGWARDDVGDALWLLVENAEGAYVLAGEVSSSDSGLLFDARQGLDSTGQTNSDRALDAARQVLGDNAFALDSRPTAVLASHEPGTAAAPFASAFDIICPGCSKAIGATEGAIQVGEGFVTGDPAKIEEGFGRVVGGTVDSGKDLLFPPGTDPFFEAVNRSVSCNRLGPGHHPDGSGRPLLVEQFLGHINSAAGAIDADASHLARAWMPAIKLSADEPCGEMLRTTARVYLIDEFGAATNDVAKAARAQITYTLFFVQDGGIAFVVGTHPGDNEGFSVGLVRSTHDDPGTRCAVSDFELYGGKSAAHKSWGGGLLYPEEDQISAADWAGPCPPLPASWGQGLYPPDAHAPTMNTDYFVWASKTKHGVYFTKDRCEDALRGFEQCDEGRTPYDLHHWLELVSFADPTAECVEPCEGCSKVPPSGVELRWPPAEQSLLLGNSSESYVCASRGDTYPFLYQVPGIANAPHAPVPAVTVEQIPVPDVVGKTKQQAEADLRAAGFDPAQLLGTYPVADDSGLAGMVAFQDPAAGAFAIPGSVVEYQLGEVDLVEVPNLYEFSPDQVDVSVTQHGLNLNVAGERPVGSNARLIGLIVEQSPQAGTMVRRGAVIDVWVGVASQVEVPDLERMTEAQARSSLQTVGLTLSIAGEDPVGPDSGLVDRVTRQSPVAGAEVAEGASVQIWLGVVDEVEVPDLIGLTASQAEAELNRLGLVYSYAGTVAVGQGDPLDGLVAEQDPAYPSMVAVGSRVQVRIGDSPDLVEVPCLGDELLADAEAMVEARSLTLSVRYVEISYDDWRDGRVISQDPYCGASVQPGATVYVDVGRAGSPPSDEEPLRFILTWDGVADLDLWVLDPNGDLLGWDRTPVRSGGQHLGDNGDCYDIPASTGYEEVAVWPNGPIPHGEYTIRIVAHCAEYGSEDFELEIGVDGGYAAGGWGDHLYGNAEVGGSAWEWTVPYG